MIIQPPEMTVSEPTVLVESEGFTTSTEVFVHALEASNSAMDVSEGDTNAKETFAPVQGGTWDIGKGMRFSELSEKQIDGDILPEEYVEFESLAELRASNKNKRTADEILWERRQRVAFAGLINSLNKYVELYEGAR